ncbi:hypothetical protein [Vibrio parahaemolyticus]|uniref:hypothetical protein n=1 Tax=Vibrio parahaemolyticus TaxID=670 RepID=UPI00112339C7|nr:hypothetical protein [Vibrio parahaemolyticus]TOG86221.1 hypothetical protein CGI92_24970 [Vibrio parahaemolyticus]
MKLIYMVVVVFMLSACSTSKPNKRISAGDEIAFCQLDRVDYQSDPELFMMIFEGCINERKNVNVDDKIKYLYSLSSLGELNKLRLFDKSFLNNGVKKVFNEVGNDETENSAS